MYLLLKLVVNIGPFLLTIAIFIDKSENIHIQNVKTHTTCMTDKYTFFTCMTDKYTFYTMLAVLHKNKQHWNNTSHRVFYIYYRQ